MGTFCAAGICTAKLQAPALQTHLDYGQNGKSTFTMWWNGERSADHGSLCKEKPVQWWFRSKWLIDPKEGLMIHWVWDTPVVIIRWFTACALPFKTFSVLHRQGHSWRLQWGSDICTFSCHLLTEASGHCLWHDTCLFLIMLSQERFTGREQPLTLPCDYSQAPQADDVHPHP